MTRKEPNKEATLREVLPEVSLVDIGGMLKRGLAILGCWGLFLAVILLITTVTENTGYGLADFGVPDWLLWLFLAWAFVHMATSEKSYHEWSMSWFFPKLNWIGSFLFAAYLIGFVYLLNWVNKMEVGAESSIAYLLVWFGYASPFLLFASIIDAGHTKLMKKRIAAATA